jgi:hypothetical protein
MRDPDRKRCPECGMLQPESQGVCSVCGFRFYAAAPVSPIAPVILLAILGTLAALFVGVGAYAFMIATSSENGTRHAGSTAGLATAFGGVVFALVVWACICIALREKS